MWCSLVMTTFYDQEVMIKKLLVIVVGVHETFSALFVVEPRQFAGLILPRRFSKCLGCFFELIDPLCKTRLAKSTVRWA